jgi:hypothetical protein
VTKATNSRRKFGSDRHGNPNYGREAVDSFPLKTKKTNKILTVTLEGLFWIGNEVGCSSFFLWTWDLAFGSFTRWLSKSRDHENS